MSMIRIVSDGKSYFLEAGHELLDPSRPADLYKIETYLSAPYVVWDLANDGQAGAVIELLKAMRPEEQAAVLSAFNAVLGLAKNGQAEAVADIQRSLAPQAPSGARSGAASFPRNHL